jgi:RecA-family ATPase
MSDDIDLLAHLRNGAWLDQQVFPPLTFAVDNVIPEGLVLFVGAPKIGKSWFALSIALGVAAGGCALGCVFVTARPVLYLALEDGDRRMQDRCRVLLEGARIPDRFDYITRVEPGTVIPTIAAWTDRHGDQAPLVILDTLGKVMPPALPGESAYQRDYRVGGWLKRVIDACPSASLMVNHHDRKADSDDFVDSVSGTHGLAGAADTVVVLSRRRQEAAGLIKVTGRDVAEDEYAVSFAGSRWILAGGSFEAAAAQAIQMKAVAGIGDRSTEIVEFVATHSSGVTTSEVVAKFGSSAREYLRRLVAGDRIRKLDRGIYAPLEVTSHTSHTPTGGDSDGPDTPPEGP